MSRPSSRMSLSRQRYYGNTAGGGGGVHHHHPPSSRLIRRAMSAAPCLVYPETDPAFEDEWPHGREEDPAAAAAAVSAASASAAEEAFLRPHTSFHYFPEELEDDGLAGEVTGQMIGDATVDYCGGDGDDLLRQEDPEPLKVVKQYGYGYRKPAKDLYPHWSQWPQPPTTTARQSQRPARLTPAATPVSLHTTNQAAVGRSACNPVFNDLHYEPNNMTCRMKYGGDERNVIMHRGLSPRRAAPPVMPGRQLTQYGGAYGQRDYNILSSLDLPCQYNRGYQTSRCASRESRPMHRHMRHQRQDEGYLHNNSIYYSTTPNVSGYFIIHPDWVSERLSMRRSQSLLAF